MLFHSNKFQSNSDEMNTCSRGVSWGQSSKNFYHSLNFITFLTNLEDHILVDWGIQIMHSSLGYRLKLFDNYSLLIQEQQYQQFISTKLPRSHNKAERDCFRARNATCTSSYPTGKSTA